MDDRQLLESIDAKVDKQNEDIHEIKIVLKGYNGMPGLCKDHEDLKEDFGKFRRKVYLICGALVGSGALGSGLAVGLG